MRRSLTGGLIAAAAAAAAVGWLARDVPAALGAAARGERARRMRDSPNFRDGTFHNQVSTRTMVPGSATSMLRQALLGGEQRTPTAPVPLAVPTVDGPGSSGPGLSITWYGHASALVELDGGRVLFDP